MTIERIQAGNFVDAGANLAEVSLLPSLRFNSPSMTHEQRAQLYAGLMGALLGYMTADLGPDDAETLFHGFNDAFDAAREIKAKITMQQAPTDGNAVH